MKKMLALVLALAMCLGCAALAEETALVYALGAPMPDFTFTDINGVSHTLSETLKEKEMVLINLWATWCGPCESEFPFLEEAYEQYKDKVEVFALSIDENDDDAKLTEYVASHGLTFPVGHETFNLFAGFGLNGVPTSIVVDRFGNVAFLATGSQTSTDAFVRLFGLFLGDEYTQTNVLAFLPGEKPSIPPTDEAELNRALNVEGTAAPLSFTNSTDEYTWPMAVAEKDDRTVLVSTVALFVASLLPLAYGAGPVYAVGALAGGLHFVYKSWLLARDTNRATAMGSFFASLVQLSVLLVAACIDAFMR